MWNDYAAKFLASECWNLYKNQYLSVVTIIHQIICPFSIQATQIDLTSKTQEYNNVIIRFYNTKTVKEIISIPHTDRINKLDSCFLCKIACVPMNFRPKI